MYFLNKHHLLYAIGVHAGYNEYKHLGLAIFLFDSKELNPDIWYTSINAKDSLKHTYNNIHLLTVTEKTIHAIPVYPIIIDVDEYPFFWCCFYVFNYINIFLCTLIIYREIIFIT